MKAGWKKLSENRTVRILTVAAAALLLLLLCWAVFARPQEKSSTFSQTAEEERLSAILSQIRGAGNVRAAITLQEGEPVSAVVFFSGEDAILTRLRLTQAAAASLGIAENRVLVCPAENK